MEQRFLVDQYARGLCIPCIWKVDTGRSSFPSLCWCESSPSASAWQVFCGPPLLHKNLLFETEGTATETSSMHWAEQLCGLTEGWDATWHLVCCIQTCMYPHLFANCKENAPAAVWGHIARFPFIQAMTLRGTFQSPTESILKVKIVALHLLCDRLWTWSGGPITKTTNSNITCWELLGIFGRDKNQNHQFKHYMLRVAGHFWADQ